MPRSRGSPSLTPSPPGAGARGEKRAREMGSPPSPPASRRRRVSPGRAPERRRGGGGGGGGGGGDAALLLSPEDRTPPAGGAALMTDPHRLQQRQRQIDIGKNTPGYMRYVQTVPRHARAADMPRTPDKFQVCSKRSWDGQVKKWRRLLHAFDDRKPASGADVRDGSPAVELDARSERKLTRMIDDVVASELGLTPRKTSAAAMIASAAAVATPPPPGAAAERRAADRAAPSAAAPPSEAKRDGKDAAPAAAPAAPAASVASPSPLSPRFAAAARPSAPAACTPGTQLDADAVLDSADDLDEDLLFDSDDDIFALADNLQA